jgi:hypothetical protein
MLEWETSDSWQTIDKLKHAGLGFAARVIGSAFGGPWMGRIWAMVLAVGIELWGWFSPFKRGLFRGGVKLSLKDMIATLAGAMMFEISLWMTGE